MDTKFIYFRVDTKKHNYIKEELKKGVLRQGWGDSQGAILDENVNDIPFEKWGWGDWDDERKKRRKYNNIRKMLEIRKGDIIVIPKIPYYHTFTICQASGNYYFDMNNDIGDYGHCIPIDLSTITEFSYHADNNTSIVHSKLRAYQSAINFASTNQAPLRKAMQELINQESDLDGKDVSELVKEELTKHTFENFSNYSSDKIEKLVKDVFEKAGYTFVDNNSFDKKGGDADLIFSKPLDIFGDNEDFAYTFYIQVKHKKGDIDFKEVEGLDQLDKIVDFHDIDTDYKKILISTIHEFQLKTQHDANKRGTVLINGMQLAELVMKYL